MSRLSHRVATKIQDFEVTSGYFQQRYKYQGGLLPDLVGVRYISFNEIVWC